MLSYGPTQVVGPAVLGLVGVGEASVERRRLVVGKFGLNVFFHLHTLQK